MERVLQVGLDDDAGVDVGEVGLGEQLAEQLEGDVLGVVLLHVEVDERAAVAASRRIGPEPFLGVVQAQVPRQRLVVRWRARSA